MAQVGSYSSGVAIVGNSVSYGLGMARALVVINMSLNDKETSRVRGRELGRKIYGVVEGSSFLI